MLEARFLEPYRISNRSWHRFTDSIGPTGLKTKNHIIYVISNLKVQNILMTNINLILCVLWFTVWIVLLSMTRFKLLYKTMLHSQTFEIEIICTCSLWVAPITLCYILSFFFSLFIVIFDIYACESSFVKCVWTYLILKQILRSKILAPSQNYNQYFFFEMSENNSSIFILTNKKRH